MHLSLLLIFRCGSLNMRLTLFSFTVLTRLSQPTLWLLTTNLCSFILPDPISLGEWFVGEKEFWLCCEEYRYLPQDSVLAMAAAEYIDATHLNSSASLYISAISQNSRKDIQMTKNNLNPFLFQQAQKEAYQQMETIELQPFLLDNFGGAHFTFIADYCMLLKIALEWNSKHKHWHKNRESHTKMLWLAQWSIIIVPIYDNRVKSGMMHPTVRSISVCKTICKPVAQCKWRIQFW